MNTNELTPSLMDIRRGERTGYSPLKKKRSRPSVLPKNHPSERNRIHETAPSVWRNGFGWRIALLQTSNRWQCDERCERRLLVAQVKLVSSVHCPWEPLCRALEYPWYLFLVGVDPGHILGVFFPSTAGVYFVMGGQWSNKLMILPFLKVQKVEELEKWRTHF